MDAEVVKSIIKSTHIFNDIKIASKPHFAQVEHSYYLDRHLEFAK